MLHTCCLPRGDCRFLPPAANKPKLTITTTTTTTTISITTSVHAVSTHIHVPLAAGCPYRRESTTIHRVG